MAPLQDRRESVGRDTTPFLLSGKRRGNQPGALVNESGRRVKKKKAAASWKLAAARD